MKVKILKTVAMAYSKDKVIDKVENLARPINEHFLKCYLVDCSGELYEHWLGELKGWLNKLYTYKCKSNNKPLPAKDFYNIFMDTDLDSPENLKNIERYAAEDENRVKDCIGNCAGNHTEHGVFGASVCPNEIAQTICDNKKRHSQERDSRILAGIWQHIRSGAKNSQQGIQEAFSYDSVEDSGYHHQHNAAASDFCSLLRFILSQVQGKPGGTANSNQKGNRQTNCGEGIGYICGCVAKITYPLPNKNLINNIVYGTHKGGGNTGQGKFPQQCGHLFVTELIFRHQIDLLPGTFSWR